MDPRLWSPPKGFPHSRQGLSPPASELTQSVSIFHRLEESFFTSHKETHSVWVFQFGISVLKVEGPLVERPFVLGFLLGFKTFRVIVPASVSLIALTFGL